MLFLGIWVTKSHPRVQPSCPVTVPVSHTKSGNFNPRARIDRPDVTVTHNAIYTKWEIYQNPLWDVLLSPLNREASYKSGNQKPFMDGFLRQ